MTSLTTALHPDAGSGIGSDVTMHEKPTILVTLSGGGFSFETKCLLRVLEHEFSFVYLATWSGGDPGEPGIPVGPRYEIPAFSSLADRDMRVSAKAFVGSFRIARAAIKAHKIAAVLTVGCSQAGPTLLAGRLAGRRTIYIESITRVDRLSNTGRLVYYLRLARTFIVQWPALHAAWPNSTLGTIL